LEQGQCRLRKRGTTVYATYILAVTNNTTFPTDRKLLRFILYLCWVYVNYVLETSH